MRAPRHLLLAGLLGLPLAACGDRSDGAHEEAVRTFLRGNRAFTRSVALEAEGRRTGGDPEALMAAVMRAEDALAFWQAAAATRMDWPEARRNVERGLLRIDRLREKRAGGRRPRPPSGRPGPGEEPPDAPPRPEPPRPPSPQAGSEEDRPPVAAPKLQTGELPAHRVLELFELLQSREREKRAVRRSWRRARAADVERDW